jgi:HSP20 family molecular chaperone IbpA
MNGYPRDMFEEMDEMFARLFSQMQQHMLTGNQPLSGYRIVVQNTGYPSAEPDIPSVQPRTTTNPVAEVHRIDDEVKVIAELPGARPESVRLDLQCQRLTIDAGEPDLPYHTTADLPPVDAGSLQQSFRNGVLEVTFQILPEKTVA